MNSSLADDFVQVGGQEAESWERERRRKVRVACEETVGVRVGEGEGEAWPCELEEEVGV